MATRGRAQAWRRGGGAEEVPERVEALRARERRSAPERAPSSQRSDTPRQGEAGGGERLGPAGTNDDARTLWIDWDGQGERHKPWRTVCQESRQLDHARLGLGGEGTALHMEVILPGLPSYAMRRAKEEADIQNAQARGRPRTAQLPLSLLPAVSEKKTA